MSNSTTYNFNQIRGYADSYHIQNSLEASSYRYQNIYGTYITDKKITYNFLQDKAYYLLFKINRNLSYIHHLSVVLYNTDNEEEETLLVKKVKIEPGEGYAYIEMMVIPDDDYPELRFILERYSHFNESEVIQIEDIVVYQLSNLFDDYSNNTIKKIGIQTTPNTIFCINKDEIKIGQNGVFETNNEDIKIYYLAIAPTRQLNNSYFIIDFLYDDIGG